MRISLLAAIALLGLESNGFAADAIATTEPAPAPLLVASTYNWSGAYIGAQAGYAWGSSFGGGFFKAGGADVVGSVDPRGFLGGLHAGYNYQLTNNLVIGAEGDINFASIKGSVDPMHDASGNPSPPGNSASADMTWNGSVRLRAGYAIDRLLPYLTGGLAFGRYKYEPSYGATGPLPGSKTQTGWDVGAGLEYAFTDHLTSRVEYRYTDFGRATYDIPGFPADETRIRLKTNDVRIGLTYKF
ncbi:outer membrane protein [Mesorhizobium sp.]|uniref:outer membrane protein n=1 Tax=Mesorhizobium sp. TaxID=1871066 RepID=UPI0025FCDE03|nr:outer membrane protein [Mesorhizobium sp.]